MMLTIFKWLLSKISINKELVLDILEVIVKHRDNPVDAQMVKPITEALRE